MARWEKSCEQEKMWRNSNSSYNNYKANVICLTRFTWNEDFDKWLLNKTEKEFVVSIHPVGRHVRLLCCCACVWMVLDIWKSEANGLSACWPRAKPTQLRAQLLEINIRTSFSLLSFTHKHIGQWHLINDDFQEYKKRKFFHSNTFLILFLFCSISHSLLHFLFHSLSLSRCQWQIAID